MPDLDELLNTRGHAAEFGAYVTAACFSGNGGQAGFALGDGSLRLRDGQGWSRVEAHAGAMLSLAAHPLGGFCCGGDDGKLLSILPGGEVTLTAEFGRKWVEHVVAYPGKTPLLAAAVGKNVHLFSAAGEKIREFAHPSTVTGIAFDARGKRLAAAHYNGASLWFTASSAQSPRLLEWKGSHLGVAIHPKGEALVTAMQENALHGWTLPEAKHMRMSGYAAKPESFGFTRGGRWLATAGAEAVVLWPFFGGGPMGKAPSELGASDGSVKRIACHPEHEVVAAGFDTGMVVVIDIAREQILPVCGPGRGGITALGWSASGAHLALGTVHGFAAVVDFSA